MEVHMPAQRVTHINSHPSLKEVDLPRPEEHRISPEVEQAVSAALSGHGGLTEKVASAFLSGVPVAAPALENALRRLRRPPA